MRTALFEIIYLLHTNDPSLSEIPYTGTHKDNSTGVPRHVESPCTANLYLEGAPHGVRSLRAISKVFLEEFEKFIAQEFGGGDFQWTPHQEDRNKLWQARHDAAWAAKALRPDCSMWVTDVCVPISKLAECIVETKKDLATSSLLAPLVGHVGDGNFHLAFLIDRDKPDELVEADQTPGPGQIRDSNRWTLASQVLSAGGEPQCLPVVADDRAQMEQAVRQGMEADVLLLTGGSSVGRYDFSQAAVAATGARCWFQKIAIKPGKPVIYFTLEERQVFCLPGNPVSAFVTFELLVRAALERRSGLAEVWPVPLRLPLTSSLSAPKSRALYQVARLQAASADGWVVEPIQSSGSGDLVSIASSNALVHLEAGGAGAAGEEVAVLPLRRGTESFPRSAEPVP